MRVYDTSEDSWCKWLYATPKDIAWGLHLLGVGVTKVLPGEQFFMDDSGLVRPWYAAMYLVQGEGTYRSKQAGNLTVRAGDMFLYFPGLWHSYRPTLETGWMEYWVTFDGSWAGWLLEQGILSPSSPIFHLGPNNPVEGMLSDLLDAVIEQPSPTHPELAARLYQILASAAGNASSASGGMLNPSDVMRARRYLEERTDQAVSISEMAVHLNMSPRNLHYAFKEATGDAPRHYHMRLRIAAAKGLLENRNLMVKEVASRLGFHDQYHFSKVFKRFNGMSPEEWRRWRLRGEIN